MKIEQTRASRADVEEMRRMVTELEELERLLEVEAAQVEIEKVWALLFYFN
jgi:hypothetical protein